MAGIQRTETTRADSGADRLPGKEMRQIFWRSFTLLGSFNFQRMQGLGFLFALIPSLKRIYRDDEQGMKDAMHRHIATFNMTVAPSPLVMGAALAMEEKAKADPSFDRSAISAVKVSLMGPLSGIGDTFFWGIFRVLACSLAIGLAQQGSFLAPIILLVTFNIPNFLTRYYGLRVGYKQGHGIMRAMNESHRMRLFTYCAGIVGAMAMGSMIALWVPIGSPLEFTINKNDFVIQDLLDEIFPALLPVGFTLGILAMVKKRIPMMAIIGIVMVVGFALGALNVIK